MPTNCLICGESLTANPLGRPQRFCSHRCRQADRKSLSRARNGLRYRTGRVKPKSASQRIETTVEFKQESLSPKRQPLTCERVNEVTFKITNGELTNVPTSHGQWGGYRTKKALAWVINVGPNSWLARCGNQACGPSTFPQAKADALAMARGQSATTSSTTPSGT
jgi:hypothetical protein